LLKKGQKSVTFLLLLIKVNLETTDEPKTLLELANQMSDLTSSSKKPSAQSTDLSSSSSNASPRRIYNQNKVFRPSRGTRQDSQEESMENDSDLDSTICINNYNKDDDVLYQLIKNIFQICIEVPVEYVCLFGLFYFHIKVSSINSSEF
jgi:hypothetical protein